MNRPSMEILARDPASRARAGLLWTTHGAVPTPAFAPVGTLGSVKACWPQDLADMGTGLLMCNAYHLSQRPGAQTVRDLGGLHRLAAWDGPLMTDSGGFQVFSLATRRKVDADGVSFRSHLDGSLLRFTPESTMALQAALGADLIMPLDVCSPFPASESDARQDMELTLAWGQRALDAASRSDQLLYGIVQGGVHPDLRRASARDTARLGFGAFAIGGLSVGEPKELMLPALGAALDELPEAAPRHLLGLGQPDDIIAGVLLGIDTFDCVMPTRVARMGGALTMAGRLNMRNAMHARDAGPIDPLCACRGCQSFSRGAIRHFVKSGEILGAMLLTLHNLHFLHDLVTTLRRAILDGELGQVSRRLAAQLPAAQSARIEGLLALPALSTPGAHP